MPDSENRNGERFNCGNCGYQADADIAAAMNIAAIAMGLAPLAKEARLHAEASGDVATPLSTFIKAGANPAKS